MNGKVTYRQQYTRCGKQRCRKCQEGSGHGPYWYAYWSEGGRTVSKYIGIDLPDIIKAEQAEKKQHGDDDKAAHSTSSTSSTLVLRISVLGQFRIERLIQGEWQAIDSRARQRRRARALLGCLLSSPGRRLGREQVMDLLWPDLDIAVASNRLNGAVHELRQLLEPDLTRPALSSLLRLEHDVLELADRRMIWIDAEEFENLLKEADTAPTIRDRKKLQEKADALYPGHYLLEELYSEWAMPRRDTLQRAWIGLLLSMANTQIQMEEYTSAIETLDRLRTADPSNETALQRLMILLTHLDRRGEALQIYQRHARMLEQDYEGEPLEETTDLFKKLRKGHVPTLLAPLSSQQTEPVKPEQQEESPQTNTATTIQTAAQEITFTRPLLQLGRHNQSPLIGRDSEIDILRQIIYTIEGTQQNTTPINKNENTKDTGQTLLPIHSSSRPRHPHCLLLKGEPGIGKTRLAEEVSLEAYARSWTVAWSRSYEQENTIPYRPWTELLRTLFQSTGMSNYSTLQELKKTGGTLFGIRLERLSTLLPDLGTQQPQLSAISHEQERLHLWEETLSFLEMFSHAHPLLLVLDDLHWADDSSIELLTYLIHHLQDQRILFVGTCRDGELAPQHKLRTLITDLRREQAIAIVPVLPLTQSQIGSLVAHLPSNMVESIQEQASGNPFFAEELARYAGHVSQDENPSLTNYGNMTTYATMIGAEWIETTARNNHQRKLPDKLLPEAISAVLERRLNRLSTGCQTLLSKAAVLGGSFELNQLRPMANEQDEDSILDQLEEALSAGLLIEEGTGAHITYHFWHPLIISHLYGRLSAARRAQLHRKAAEAIKMAAAPHTEKAAARLVYHLGKGGGEPETIAHYAEIAGNQAYILAAYAEAQKYYLQVLQALMQEKKDLYGNNVPRQNLQETIEQLLTYHFPHEAQTDPLHICRMLEHIAECSTIQGNFAEGRAIYTSLLKLRTSAFFRQQIEQASTEKEAQQRQEAQIQALLWREIGNTWTATGEYEQAYICYGKGKEVMSQANVQSGAAWACLHLQNGAMLRLEGKYHEARRYLQEALDMLTQTVATAAEPSSGKHLERNETEQQRGPLTRIERALYGDPLEIGYAHERLGIVAASLGEQHAGLIHLHTALTIFEHQERMSETARVCGNLGAVYITHGEHEAARKYLKRSLELAERGEDLPNMAFVMVNLGDIAQRSGELIESESFFQQSLVLSNRIHDRERIAICNVALAAVQEDLGKIEEASQSIYRSLVTGHTIKSTRCIRRALIGLADLRIARALQLRSKEEPAPHDMYYIHQLLVRARSTLKRTISSAGMEIEIIIDGKHLLALVYLLLDDLDTALAVAMETLKDAQGHETMRIIGRVYHLLGRILARQGEYKQADQYFQEAIRLGQARGLTLDYARALYGYGLMLLQQSETSRAKENTHNDPLTEILRQQGAEYLRKAWYLFNASQSRLDLIQCERALHDYRLEIAEITGRIVS